METDFSRKGLLLRSLERVLAFIFVLVLVSGGIVQGLDTLVFEWTASFVQVNFAILEALSSVLGFTVFILVCTFLAVLQIFYQNRNGTYSEDSSVVAVVPTYLDSHALEVSVPSLADLEYEDLKIVPVCEEDDDDALEKCKDLSERFDSVEYVVNDMYSGTKAGAINCAAEKTDSDVLAFFDADQDVQNGFVRRSIALIEEEYDVVQARVVPRPNGLIETLCYGEALFMYVIPERLADFLTRYKVAGSRGTIVQRDVFEEMNGYDADFLTEDMDFAFRCYEQGKKVKPLLSEACTEEAPHSLADYWGQRKRWVKGHIEVFISRLKYLYQYRSVPYLKSAFLSGIIPIGWFFLFLLASKFLILMILGFNLFASIGLLTIIIISLGFRIYDRKYLENRLYPQDLFYIIFMPLVFPLYGAVAVKCLFEYALRNSNSWYRVEKKN